MERISFLKSIYFFLVLFLFPFRIIAQEQVVEINSIVLNETIELTIKDIDNATYHVSKKIKVLNAEDLQSLYFLEFTHKYSKLIDLKIIVFDSTGNEKVNYYDLDDVHVESNGNGLVEEGKVYHFEIPYQHFPLVYEIQYNMKLKSSLFYPAFHFLRYNQQVVHASYKIHTPIALDIRHKAYNCELEPSRSVENNAVTYTWQVQNVSPVRYEKGSANQMQLLPHVEISPTKFKVDKYEGELDTWDHYGNWYRTLSSGRDEISPELKTTLKQLVDGIQDPKEKANRIYSYMQQNFRYVLISLGIGGFQPASAISTFNTKYGDCKALSNFMQASLKEVGIKSYQCLINASYNQQPIDTTFPNHTFNHVILCIPFEKDTTWLECTSKESEFGELGNFTENRTGLLVTEQGGILVQTPVSNYSKNSKRIHTNIDLKPNGEALLETKIYVQGECKMPLIKHILENSEKEKKSYLINEMKLKQPDEIRISCTREEKNIMTTINAFYSDISEMKSKTKIFLSKSMFSIFNQEPPKFNNRQHDYYFQYPFTLFDTVKYKIPPNYELESIPGLYETNSDYISYNEKIVFSKEKGELEIQSMFTLKKHIISAKDYAAFWIFYQEILDFKARKLILSH